MAEPITVPIEADPEELKEIGFDFMRANIPGWDDSRGDPDSQTIAACAQIIAEGAGPASDVPLAIFRYLGRWVDGLLPIDATPAQTTATVTALDDLGYTINDGDRFEVKTSGDTGVVFFAVGSVTIAPGSTSTATGEVVLVAETSGGAGTGLPVSSEVVPVDALAWVDTVTLTAITTGGVDAETDEQYIGRWITLRQLSNDTPILAVDAAALIQALIPGVGRTLALDNYDPVAGTFGNEKMITVAVADDAGEPVAGALVTAAETLIESRRELNFVCHVIGATYETVAVATEFVTYPGFDVDGVEAAVRAALDAYLDPATFSTPPGSDATLWLPKTHVRRLDVAAVIDRVEGVDYITTLTLTWVKNVTALAASNVFTSAAHGMPNGYQFAFSNTTGGAPINEAVTYFARDVTANTFTIAATPGGPVVDITTNLTAGQMYSFHEADVLLRQPAALTRPSDHTIIGTAP